MTKQDTKTITLYELIMHADETIYRNALSILKRLRDLTPVPCKHPTGTICAKCAEFPTI